MAQPSESLLTRHCVITWMFILQLDWIVVYMAFLPLHFIVVQMKSIYCKISTIIHRCRNDLKVGGLSVRKHVNMCCHRCCWWLFPSYFSHYYWYINSHYMHVQKMKFQATNNLKLSHVMLFLIVHLLKVGGAKLLLL